MIIKKLLTFLFCTTSVMLFAQNITGSQSTSNLANENNIFSQNLQLAQSGNIEAMNKVGILYKEGIGTKANKKEAIFWLNKAAERGLAKANYNLGIIYKDGIEEEQDFNKAFDYFNKGALANDSKSIYAKGYLLYKGFGCIQNYEEAMKCFSRGANEGKAISMYYLGLSYRNGYGITKNIESAKYWLNQASLRGEGMAFQELNTNTPENSNPSTTAFGNNLISKTTKNITKTTNTVIKIENAIEANVIEGKYKGVILKYDWSKKYFLTKTVLEIELNYVDGFLNGTWVEQEKLNTSFKALLTQNNLKFENTEYKKLGHYNPKTAISYSFKNAKLQWQTIEDSLVLSGTIQMWDNYSNEPQNVQYIYLTKYKSTQSKQKIKLLNDDGTEMKNISKLTVYPNPFERVVNIEFENKALQKIEISILNADGKTVYKKDLGLLQQGAYSFAAEPNDNLSAGVYVLKFQSGTNTKTIKLVKI